MNGLIRWDPFRELEEVKNRFSSVLGRPTSRQYRGEGEEWLDQWSPPVDIIEEEKEFMVSAELPGLKKEDIHVTVNNGNLTISGERKTETKKEEKKYYLAERCYGSFERTFGLPENTDAGKVSAEFNDGILRVHIPKTEAKAQPKPQEIQIG